MPYTPMMLQYFNIKDQYKEHLLFYRLGDFYEMFFEDAITASRELELTLTGRDCGMEERAPMCGVPYHSADGYITRLVKKGYKVAICEQLEDPAKAKGIVKRDVVRIITPGTVTEGSLLVEGQNNYLCAIFLRGGRAGFCVADISTAEIHATEFSGGDLPLKLLNEVGLYAPSEVIVNLPDSAFGELAAFVRGRLGGIFSAGEHARFEETPHKTVKRQFGAEVLSKNGIAEESPVIPAIAALVSYLSETQKTDISYINTLNYYSSEQFLGLDINTRRNLELCETMRTREKRGTLLWILDRTKTAMGARLLRKWIEQPLLNCNMIQKRQQAVEELFHSYIEKEEIVTLLSKVSDLERLMTKVIYNTANCRDLKALEHTVSILPRLKKLLSGFSSPELANSHNGMDILRDIGDYIAKAIAEDPPFSIREGGFIKKGFDETVDELRDMMNEGKVWIAKIEQKEREQTGIKTLKVGYNRVFGYYIEVTKSYLSQVPDRYVRKQTLTGCERYITQELKEMEARVLGAQDKIVAVEYELFQKLREYIAGNIHRVQNTAGALSKIDAYTSLADAAKKNGYVCPEVDYSDKVEIDGGRHPIVERFLGDGLFVPNDTYLDSKRRLMLITGPNMAGKSTYMRQTALIIIMAQIGSFVPAKHARIGIVDRLFTRVGASDDLASGQSTFMLEMNEVAYILRHATAKSFIIYDEIGRGTSTFDGMSIARAVVEYTAGKKCGAKTMFATHYHELTELANHCEGVVNYNIAAKKRGDEIVFLRKIVEGAADDSYGIEVAKLAGVPDEVVNRAKDVLSSLESQEPIRVKGAARGRASAENEANLSFEELSGNEVIEQLKALDINIVTPIEALTKLHELKNMLNGSPFRQ